ncbi:FAD-dependent monooxygenase [Streptomyces beijiangensis]|uniref:FAD-dependent monooxygenase n=1 Tax=Streptomyces beijiangensis TaxID=163361 RepID=A0A939FBJ5_9ACTN|nr:FAD-dependent monooxygenase [Streptomyces beijiangensis]MBO0514437.1 FAD-dependent monooxygenase [Streptomyces beijiangensis]
MKVVCVGGGPASFYLSILLKKQEPRHEVSVLERRPAGSTYGWGVTYWPDMFEELTECDPDSAREIAGSSVHWSEGTAHIGGRTVTHPGGVGHAIGRHRLLNILTERAEALGVRVEFGSEVQAAPDPSEADLVVVGDGAHSQLRDRHAEAFGTRRTLGANQYIWLGTTRVFTSFTFAFVETAHGWIWCYAYGYSAHGSTFIAECSTATWTGLGLDRLPEEEALRLLEELFAGQLEGHPLTGRTDTGGRPQWQNFTTVANTSWSHGNLVLIGDAAHTTHYSTGAGTTLALRDAMSLARELRNAPDPAAVPSALAAYAQERQRALLPAQSAARLSAQWYENLARYLDLDPHQMFSLLGQRHSPLLPHLPPRLYYQLDQTLGRLQALRWLKQRVGSRLASTLQSHHAERAGSTTAD